MTVKMSYIRYSMFQRNRPDNSYTLHWHGHMVHSLYNVRYTFLCSFLHIVLTDILCKDGCIWWKCYNKNQLKSVSECSTVYKYWSANLLLLQFLVVYPGLHPFSHSPDCLLHGEVFRQWPLQLLTQLYPYLPSLHSVTDIAIDKYASNEIQVL